MDTVLVTQEIYSIGAFHCDNLVKSITGTGYINQEHKKGGRSVKRFARRTEEQKKDFCERSVIKSRRNSEFAHWIIFL